MVGFLTSCVLAALFVFVVVATHAIVFLTPRLSTLIVAAARKLNPPYLRKPE